MRADFPNVSLFDRGTVSSSRPVVATASRADAVKDGRCPAAASHSAVARPRLDGGEHDAILHDRRAPFPTQPALMVATASLDTPHARGMTSASARQFNTRLLSGLSSENVGTSISNRSPLSLSIS